MPRYTEEYYFYWLWTVIDKSVTGMLEVTTEEECKGIRMTHEGRLNALGKAAPLILARCNSIRENVNK